jgi:hypothetical protein
MIRSDLASIVAGTQLRNACRDPINSVLVDHSAGIANIIPIALSVEMLLVLNVELQLQSAGTETP